LVQLLFSLAKKIKAAIIRPLAVGFYGVVRTQFESYDTNCSQGPTGVLNQKIQDAAKISVNKTIYVPGG
jgi:hypothetical protein